jgi:hypothetical protein
MARVSVAILHPNESDSGGSSRRSIFAGIAYHEALVRCYGAFTQQSLDHLIFALKIRAAGIPSNDAFEIVHNCVLSQNASTGVPWFIRDYEEPMATLTQLLQNFRHVWETH